MKRIDVDDMLITRQDGTQYKVQGTYTITMEGCEVLKKAKTKTGISVPKGYAYKLHVRADSEQGLTQHQHYTIDYTN